MENLRYLVGIGSSAGGLEALQDFLSNLPETVKNAAFDGYKISQSIQKS